jgi:hypothetical protein
MLPTVMPFGPVNGLSTFIAFNHDIDLTWKNLASYGLTIDDDTNANIIVDDILMGQDITLRATVHGMSATHRTIATTVFESQEISHLS